ncbi:PREDICTED: F-box protein At1g61340-like [Camelina sativa]|uniref:F-box protein At1g61340-like n=1 Tax=Camelina sativa TaxID=90675 RepID=A0ABM0WTR5_CAMSA|nr:PREDICTED: F-box protein At1g61340-like [Camelina sativa]
MALGKKKVGDVKVKSSSNSNGNVFGTEGGVGLGLDFVKYNKRGLARKRLLISGSKVRDSTKNHEEGLVKSSGKLEALPQDILVRIICGVEHEDLKQLFNVSKTIREATLIAKKWHFEYTTPRKTLFSRRSGLESMIEGDKIKAPLQKKYGFSRILCHKKVSKISMALFK